MLLAASSLTTWAIAAAATTAVVAPIVTWLVARRVNAGSTRNSDAEQLWKAAEAMRTELHDEVAALNARISENTKLINDSADVERQLRSEIVREQRFRVECQERLARAQVQIEALKFQYGVLLTLVDVDLPSIDEVVARQLHIASHALEDFAANETRPLHGPPPPPPKRKKP